jgi:hypothetical protein
MAKARKTTRRKGRKTAAKAKAIKRRARTKPKRKPPKRKRRVKQPSIADRIASAAQIVTESIEETTALRRKMGARGGLSEG